MTFFRLAGAKSAWGVRLDAVTAGAGVMPSLLRGVMWFWCADILYTSFASAYAYSHFGVQGVLAYLFGTQFAIVVGFLATMQGMHRTGFAPWHVYRYGVAAMFASLLAAGLLAGSTSALAALGALALIGGAGRGMAFSARVWLELHHTDAAQRERYLSLAEAIGALLRLVIPVLAGILLAQAARGQSENFTPLFAATGVLGLVGTLFSFGTPLVTPSPGPLSLRQPFGLPVFWRTAPYFVVDGAGLALRTALFVSGAMALVGSAAKYSLVEAGASLFAIGLLVWFARHAKPAPSLPLLRNNLGLLAIGWLTLILALRYPVLLPLFVAAYALSTPLVAMVKSGLNLKALVLHGIETQDAMASRMLLFSSGRIAVLGASWLLISAATGSAEAAKLNIVLLSGLAVILLPVEYYYSRRLQQP